MGTITLEVPEKQVVEWVRQLSPAAKQAVLQALIPGLSEFETLVDYGSERMRELCVKRGVNWNSLTEDERERLIDKLLHEA